MPDVRTGPVKADPFVTQQHSGKVVLPAKVANGLTVKADFKLKDTVYYQVGPHGDYVQDNGTKS